MLLGKHKGKINNAAEEGEINKPVDKMNFISISWLLEQEMQAFLMRSRAIIASFFSLSYFIVGLRAFSMVIKTEKKNYKTFKPVRVP